MFEYKNFTHPNSYKNCQYKIFDAYVCKPPKNVLVVNKYSHPDAYRYACMSTEPCVIVNEHTLEKLSLPTLQNFVAQGKMQAVTDKTPYILALDRYWYRAISEEELVQCFMFINDSQPIRIDRKSLDERHLDESWARVRPSNAFLSQPRMACFVPSKVKAQLNTIEGIVTVNEEYAMKGKGDFLVCPKLPNGKPDLNRLELYNYQTFGRMFNNQGWTDCIQPYEDTFDMQTVEYSNLVHKKKKKDDSEEKDKSKEKHKDKDKNKVYKKLMGYTDPPNGVVFFEGGSLCGKLDVEPFKYTRLSEKVFDKCYKGIEDVDVDDWFAALAKQTVLFLTGISKNNIIFCNTDDEYDKSTGEYLYYYIYGVNLGYNLPDVKVEIAINLCNKDFPIKFIGFQKMDEYREKPKNLKDYENFTIIPTTTIPFKECDKFKAWMSKAKKNRNLRKLTGRDLKHGVINIGTAISDGIDDMLIAGLDAENNEELSDTIKKFLWFG
jgi:hypothetical protein